MVRLLCVSVLVAVLGVCTGASSDPYTPTQYRDRIGWGFDTDIFKNTPPLRRYNAKVMEDLSKRGVTNLRLRSRADIFGYAADDFDTTSMDTYLDGLETVVGDMVKHDMNPIISWIHHNVEENSASDTDRDNYVDWWKRVALRMKGESYNLAFNLFTEIGEGALRDVDKYNDWTRRAVAAIRGTGGKNKKRIIILGAPSKKSESLFTIAKDIYEKDEYLMAEWHLYASGPNQNGGQKNWKGKGSKDDKANVDKVMDEATRFTKESGVPTWIGAWMPYDNIDGSLTQSEVLAFGCYFNKAATSRSIPWSMNKMENFYDTEKNEWVVSNTIGRGDTKITLKMAKVLDAALCRDKSGAAEEGTGDQGGATGHVAAIVGVTVGIVVVALVVAAVVVVRRRKGGRTDVKAANALYDEMDHDDAQRLEDSDVV